MASQNPNKTSRLAESTLDTLIHSPMQAAKEVVDNLKEAGEEKSEFLSSFRESFRALDEKVRAQISTNLEGLISRNTNAGLEALKVETDAMQQLLSTEVEKVKTSGKEVLQAGFLPSVESVKGVGNKMEKMTDVMLPPEWTKHMSRGQKIGVSAVTGVAVAFAVYKVGKWLFGRGKKSAEAGKEEAKKSKGGFFKKLAIGLGIGALAFGSYKAYELYKEVGSFKGMMEKMQKEFMAKINGVSDFINPSSPEQKYKLTKNEYARAQSAYSDMPIKTADVEIRKIFKLKNGETSKEYEEFMKDMKSKHERYSVNGVEYSEAEMCKDKYEYFFEGVIGDIMEWVEKHPVETAVGGFFAYKFGVIQKALHVSGSVFKKCMAVGRALMRFGVRHPLVSLLMTGGAIGAVFASKRQLEGALAPADMSELAKALVDGKPIFIDAESKEPIDNVSANMIAGLSEGTSSMLKNIDALASNLSQATIEMLGQIWEDSPDVIRLTEQEYVVTRNGDGFDDLWSSLQKKEKRIMQNKDIDQGEYDNIFAIRMALSKFEGTFFSEVTSTGINITGKTQDAYKSFVVTMEKAGFEVKIENGLVQYRSGDSGEFSHLCIDPYIDNEDEAIDVTTQLNYSEGMMTNLWNGALNEVRMSQDSDNILLMAAGNIVYVYDPRNVGHYIVCHYDAIKSGLTDGVLTEEFARSAGAAIGTTALVSISAVSVTAIKRLAIGGKNPVVPRFGDTGKWVNRAANIVPGVHPVKTALKVRRGVEDIIEFTQMYRASRDANLGIMRSRRLAKDAVNAYSIEKMRPQWIRNLMEGSHSQRELALLKIDFFDAKSLSDLEKDLSLAEKSGDYSKFNTNAASTIKSKLGTFIRGDTSAEDVFNLIMRTKVVEDLAAKLARNKAVLEGGGSVDDLFKSGAHADEIFDAAIEAKGGTHFDDLVKTLEGMDEAARATHMERLCKNIPIDDLKNVGFAIDDILLGAKNLKGADKVRFIIDASKVYGVNKLVSGGLSASEVHEILKNADPSLVPAKLVTEAEDLMKTAKTATAADVLGVKNALDPKALARLDDLMQDPFFAKLIKESRKSPDEAVAFMKHFDELSPDTLIRLKESRGARKLLAGAIRTGEQAEVDHILKIANRAARIRVAINAAGVAGDMFCIYMMFEDLKANEMRIQKTNNPQLKLLYEQADLLYYAEGASGAAGLLLYGVAVYSSATAGAGIVAALGAPAGLVLLPLAAATYGARVTYVALERSAEYHTLTEKDIAGFSQGKILQHINATDSNTRLNFSQSLAEWVPTDSWTEWGGEYDPDSANLGARHEGYRAYYSLIALSVLPAPTILDLDIDAEKLLAMEPEEQHRLLKIYQQDTNSRFVFDALSYIAYRTEKSFEGVGSDILKNAQLYATRQYKTRKNNPDADMPYRAWSDRASWRDVESEIQEENASHMSALEKQMIDFSTNPKQFELSAPSIMLDLLQHDLASFEMNVLNTNYSGVADGWEMNVARGYAAWQLRKAISTLVKDSASGEKMTEGRIKQTLVDCRDVLSKNPNVYALAGYDSEYSEYFHQQGSNEFALTPRGLLGLLNSFPILTPERVSDDVGSPTPITALRHHSGSEKSMSFASDKAYISGLHGYEVKKEGGSSKKFTYGGDVMQFPVSGTYLFWEPGNSSGKPDLKVVFSKSSEEATTASVSEVGQASPEKNVAGIRLIEGNDLLSKKKYTSVESVNSYSIQYGNVFNKYLYMKFTGSKWQVSIGASEGPWSDTSNLKATSSWNGFSKTVAGKYNAIIEELDDINNQS